MRRVLKVLSVAVAPVICVLTFLSACINLNSRAVDIDNSGIMQDIDIPPETDAAYEEYSKAALAEYRDIASRYADEDGELDYDNLDAAVAEAANKAAAKLFAYACYNERTLDKYAFFANQLALTDLGKDGSATVNKQEYYLRVNESDDTCGYRYHYTLKKVTSSSGGISIFKGLFESARIRFTDKTNLLYRFEGTSSTLDYSKEEHEHLGCNLLQCDWMTGKDWGKPDIEMVKSAFIEPENIEEDIVAKAGEDNITMRGNINILAENIVKSAMILDDGEGGAVLIINIDTDVANNDEASLKMLRQANSDDCKWVDVGDEPGLSIVCRLWPNGLFRYYRITENWNGTTNGFSGTASSTTDFYYSYSDADCDMTKNLEMLEEAKKAVG